MKQSKTVKKAALKLLTTAFGLIISLTLSHGAQELHSLAGSEWGNYPRQFIQFSTEGKISGNGGCNRIFGTFSSRGNKLKIGRLASTRKACANAIMQKEHDFIQRLQEVTNYSATHLALKLFDRKNRLILRLKRRDWD